jgi:tetratricopeptide (TPR) repeat protein
MRALVVAICLVLAAPPAFGRPDSQARVLFDEATREFNAALAAPAEEKPAHFGAALAAYETLVHDKGLRSGALYFNIGNCYMHLGQLGEAILNYRLAERSIPDSRELEANREVALARRADHIAPKEQMLLGLPVGSIGRDARDWLARLPGKLVVLIAAFTLVWVVLGLKLAQRSTLLNAALVLFLVVTVVYAAAVAVQARTFAGLGHGVLLDETAAPRTGPSALHPERLEQPLHEGVEFRVLRRESGWLNVELPDSTRCWLPAKSVGEY